MKLILIISLVFISLFSNAQIRTTTFEGRTVKVFPYRIMDCDYIIDNVPYCPEVLEDGEYVIYYRPRLYWENKKDIERYKKGDTLFIAANFFIINNKKEGVAKFYRYKKTKPGITGAYKNDMKTGLWKSNYSRNKKTENYKEGKLDGKYFEKYKSSRNSRRQRTCGTGRIDRYKKYGNYKDGKLEGKNTYITYSPYDKDVTEYSNGLKNGTDKSYNRFGKLITLRTYKNDLTFGPNIFRYSTNIFDKYYYYDKGIYLIIKSFRLNENQDSFVNLYHRKRRIASVINSPTPSAGFNKNDSLWWVDFTHFNDNSIFKGYPSNFSEVYEITKSKKKFNHFYLIDNKIQIPFVIKNPKGDTIMKVDRIEMTPEYYIYKISKFEYSKGKLWSKEEKTEKLFRKPVIQKGVEFKNGYQMVAFNTEWYFKKGITKEYKLNNPIPGYRGMVIKIDSTVYSNKNQTQNYITQKYRIEGINETSSSIGFGLQDSSYLKFKYTIRMISDDTLEVIENNFLFPELNLKFIRKINVKDSSITSSGLYTLINPFYILDQRELSFMGQKNISFIGKCGYTLEFKGKPYSGPLVCRMEERKKYFWHQYDFKEITKPGEAKLLITNKIHKKRFWFFWDINYYRDGRPYYCHYYFTNGILDGNQSAWSKDFDLIYNLNFENGENEGIQTLVRDYSNSYYYDIDNKTIDHYKYKNGKLQDYVTLVSNDKRPELIAKYNDGKLNGNYIAFESQNYYTNPKVEAAFKNDTLVSDIVIYNNGHIQEIIPFNKGKITGTYIRNNKKLLDNSVFTFYENKKYLNYLELKAKLKNGAFADSITGYFDNGSIKYIAIVDSSFHHKYIIDTFWDEPVVLKNRLFENMQNIKYKHHVSRFDNENKYASILAFSKEKSIYYDYEMDLNPMNESTPAFYTFYYKNGVKSQQGHMNGDIKDGVWKYWGENGILVKEIEYRPEDVVLDSVNDITHSILGFIKGFYPAGQLMMQGYVDDIELNYQCNQELEVPYEYVYYTHFYDEKGNDILINGTGPLADFHLNGNQHFKGQITNGQRTGLWKFYDPKGNLMEIGEYIDGQKHGRWLSGDLAGINYVDNACSINEAIEMIKLNEARNIDITETLYEMGREISKSHLVLEKF